MDESISKEFINIINKLRKITHRKHTHSKVHPGEFMMLSAIYSFMNDKCGNAKAGTRLKVTELSDLIHSTKPATSKMLNSLEEKGYIERVSDSKDRRNVYIHLTNKGETIILDAFKRLQDFADRTITRMGEEDSKELLRMLNKLYDAMAEESKKEFPEKDNESDENDIYRG
jgi:DNA-binding MarR family transcriptional regulator